MTAPVSMSSAERIRRILVALDVSPHSLAALQAAAELAAGLGAELVGVFVEDANLIRLAALPLVREVGQTTARIRVLDEPRMSRQLKSLAQRAERALAREAGRRHVRWRFTVSRGTIDTELWGAASGADLVVMGRSGWSARWPAGSNVEAVLTRASHRTLVIEAGAPLQPTVLVLYDGTEMAARALQTARMLAESRSGFLTVVIVQPSAAQAKVLQRQIARELREPGLEVRYRWLIRSDRQALAELVSSEPHSVLVLPAEAPQLRDRSLGEILETLNCPVLVVP